ncbi:hypothetical protein HETIRDRAFT_447869 [Heterobasidion irregulare TC 32-1]|uniref:Uncharacterized protein n=1 Tax=Heterobasidion irregulare (strain TC 32-1) TaxID=747525 RepID=W4KNR8_HETIT|nr:uncharacterized protein HETIRDRAFT_447869 [Heterobasidion irregulare TC 32-1]ETW87334.1 hypothetical protein HETIRDRAFT_447869 [Heterobasidion irregulare TC 32-1]
MRNNADGDRRRPQRTHHGFKLRCSRWELAVAAEIAPGNTPLIAVIIQNRGPGSQHVMRRARPGDTRPTTSPARHPSPVAVSRRARMPHTGASTAAAQAKLIPCRDKLRHAAYTERVNTKSPTRSAGITSHAEPGGTARVVNYIPSATLSDENPPPKDLSNVRAMSTRAQARVLSQ